MAATDTLARLGPYAQELADNDYVRDNLRSAADNLRGAYERSQKRRVKSARDEKLRRQVQSAAASITEAGRALASGRQKPKKRRGRRLFVLVAAGAIAAGFAVAFNDDLRESLLHSAGGGSEADVSAPMSAASPAAGA
jgi:hypothetical protein